MSSAPARARVFAVTPYPRRISLGDDNKPLIQSEPEKVQPKRRDQSISKEPQQNERSSIDSSTQQEDLTRSATEQQPQRKVISNVKYVYR